MSVLDMSRQDNESTTTPPLSNTTFVSIQKNASVPDGCFVAEIKSTGFIPWNNPGNIISQETEQAVDFAVNTVCLPILFLMAVPCNILNMLVFWKQGLTERVNLCLFYLSLVDLLHMLICFLLEVDRLYPPFLQTGGPVWTFFLTHGLTGLQGFPWLSGFVSMLVMCERCLCVVSPLWSQTFLSTRITAGMLGVATVVIMTSSVIIRLKYGLVCVFNPQTNAISRTVYPTAFYLQNKSHIDALTLFTATLQPLLYAVVVMITTTVTSVSLKKMVAWREQTSSQKSSAREVALSRTLIAISVFFVLCATPTVAAGMAIVFVPGISLGGRRENLFKALITFAEMASFINATFNFFVYYSMGSRYREVLREILPCKM